MVAGGNVTFRVRFGAKLQRHPQSILRLCGGSSGVPSDTHREFWATGQIRGTLFEYFADLEQARSGNFEPFAVPRRTPAAVSSPSAHFQQIVRAAKSMAGLEQPSRALLRDRARCGRLVSSVSAPPSGLERPIS